MSQDVPPPPSPNAPSACHAKAGALDAAFDAMLLDPTTVANDNFIDDLGATDREDAMVLSSVDDAQLKDCIVAALASIWGVPTMRPGQLEACFHLLHPHRPNSVVVVHQTEGGKTHILCTLGVIEKGIVLIFISLLTLSANVMHKFKSSNLTWGNIGIYHLDKIYDCNTMAYNKLLHRCSLVEQSTSSTLFIFISPQFLIHHPDALGVFVTCTQERTLRLIAMDEVHIHVQHGSSFHQEICALRIEFFHSVYSNQPCKLQPWLIAMTATFPRSYLAILSSLLTVNFSIPGCILSGTSDKFHQQEIKMKLEMCSKRAQSVSKGLTLVADFLQHNLDNSVVIFCNSRKQSRHFAVQLEKKLDLMKLSVDVVNINGSLDKIDKFWRIRLFCDDDHSCQGKFCALITTNASNVGINKHSVALQVRFE
jgi:superfamily II DNA helicase RecQ